MLIYIENSNYGYNYNPPEKQYGSWSKSNDITEEYLTSKNNSKENIFVDFKPEIGDKLYLVKGIYTTGDSFGSETGRVEYLDIFGTYGEAESFKEKVELYNELINEDWYGFNPKQKKDKIRNLKYLLKKQAIRPRLSRLDARHIESSAA